MQIEIVECEEDKSPEVLEFFSFKGSKIFIYLRVNDEVGKELYPHKNDKSDLIYGLSLTDKINKGSIVWFLKNEISYLKQIEPLKLKIED